MWLWCWSQIYHTHKMHVKRNPFASLQRCRKKEGRERIKCILGTVFVLLHLMFIKKY